MIWAIMARPKSVGAGLDHQFRRRVEDHDHCPGHCCRRKEHGEEQNPAAEKNGGKKAVLGRAEPVAQHADEPQKGNAGERHQVQRQHHGSRHSVADHSCVSGEMAGTEMRRRTRVVVSRTEKRIPAMAAARGVFSRARVRGMGCCICCSIKPTSKPQWTPANRAYNRFHREPSKYFNIILRCSPVTIDFLARASKERLCNEYPCLSRLISNA